MKKGLTLVELLVVCAIVFLLLGILFPALIAARLKGQQTVCLSNVEQLSKAQLMYLADNDDALPQWGYYSGGRVVYWLDMFQPYLRTMGVFHEPCATESPPEEYGKKLADYALFTWHQNTPTLPYWSWAGYPLVLAQVRRPTETFNVMDGYTCAWGTHGFSARHFTGVNGAFLDGHARFVTWAMFSEVSGKGRDAYYRYCAADRD